MTADMTINMPPHEGITQTPPRIYNVEGAYRKLLEWGWPEDDLTLRQVRSWASRRKAPFYKNPVNQKMYIRENDLRSVYDGTHGDTK